MSTGLDSNMRINTDPMNNRKVFNIIVDASSLISGVRKNTRDGIKKWVNDGSIRLVVPLHTLQHLNTLATTRTDRYGIDAKETLLWLDHITSDPTIVENGVVQLQESYEVFESWAEVEQFLLPRTLLSLESSASDDGGVHMRMSHLHLEDSVDMAPSTTKSFPEVRPITPTSSGSTFSATSPNSFHAPSPYKRSSATENSLREGGVRSSDIGMNMSDFSTDISKRDRRIPKSLQPLFNHILWRVHHSSNAEADLGPGAYILLTSDHLKSRIAHSFGIRVKRIEQVREIIAREENEFRKRADLPILESDQAEVAITNTISQSSDHLSISSRNSNQGVENAASSQLPLLDPNDFGRTAKAQRTPNLQVQSFPRKVSIESTKSNRGRGSRAHSSVGRGSKDPSGASPRSMPVKSPDLPIDPDSFERPRPQRHGRGGRRVIWNPS